MEELLRVEDLHVHFDNADDGVDAVDGVSFSLNKGDILGLVGESGSGKSVSVMSVCGLLGDSKADISGKAFFAGKDLLSANESYRLSLLGDEISFVFQEPMSAMNPVMKVGPQVEEALRVHTKLSKEERRARAIAAMADVELDNPEAVYEKYPHELSGGMLQRAMIAAAIINRPQLLFADEPTTALDVTIQAQILKLLKRLNKENDMAIVFISHNLHVVSMLCEKVAVMYRGRVVERGTVNDIFRNPAEEYTKRLISSIPTRENRLFDR